MEYKHVTFEDLEDYLRIDDYFSSLTLAEKDLIKHNLGLDTIPASFCEDRERILNLFKAVAELKSCTKYNGLLSRDFGEFELNIDESYADRASKDALGNVIADTYITRNGLNNAILTQVNKAVWSKTIPDNTVTYNSLSDDLKQLVSSNTTVTNYADGEDISSVNNVLKFADKTYDEVNFSGLGRKYLRKNMTDGINYLELYMINEANTIYIFLYDYCINGDTIIIPSNCILIFLGGSINNGTLETIKKDDVIKVLDINGGTKNITFDGCFIDITTGYEINKPTSGVGVFKPTFYNNANNIGFVYYDETLQKPIWWNGENWVDATGTCVNCSTSDSTNNSTDTSTITCNCCSTTTDDNTTDDDDMIVTDRSEIL